MHPIDFLFWACLMLGGVYTLFSLLTGGLSHAAGHIGHIGHMGHALHIPHAPHGHIGPAHAGAHAPPGHAHPASGAQHAPSSAAQPPRFNLLAYLNPMAVAGFLLGFGGVGAACRQMGVHPLGSTLFAMAGGYGLWLSAYLVITRVFGGAESSSEYRQMDLIGLRAQATTRIDGLRPGMIACTVSGARQTVRAITDDEEPIPTGAAVRIRRIENGTALVARID